MRKCLHRSDGKAGILVDSPNLYLGKSGGNLMWPCFQFGCRVLFRNGGKIRGKFVKGIQFKSGSLSPENYHSIASSITIITISSGLNAEEPSRPVQIVALCRVIPAFCIRKYFRSGRILVSSEVHLCLEIFYLKTGTSEWRAS